MGAPGLAIHMGLEAGELRRLARRETDGRITARLFAIANVLDGMSRKAAAEAAWTARPFETGSSATTREGLRVCGISLGRGASPGSTMVSRRPSKP
jgi:hypothetical protein